MQQDIPRDKLIGSFRRGAVKIHVAAIHVAGKLTLLQRKLSNVLLLNAYDCLTSAPSFRMDARTLCLMAGNNSNDFDTLKASLRGLAEKLSDPKVFALINLNIQRRFTSGHALALYEYCYRFHRTGSTGWWPLETFRRLMGVDDSSYYETYKHLNAKVIKPPVAEVNRNSNIVRAPETRKEGRAVSHIRFRIAPNPQLAILDLDDGEGLRKAPVYDRLRAVGISDRLARRWIAQNGEETVAGKLDYVAADEGVKSPAKYLATTQRDADKRLFLSGLTDRTARADFESHGWMSPLNAEAIVAFWAGLYPDALEGARDG